MRKSVWYVCILKLVIQRVNCIIEIAVNDMLGVCVCMCEQLECEELQDLKRE